MLDIRIDGKKEVSRYTYDVIINGTMFTLRDISDLQFYRDDWSLIAYGISSDKQFRFYKYNHSEESFGYGGSVNLNIIEVGSESRFKFNVINVTGNILNLSVNTKVSIKNFIINTLTKKTLGISGKLISFENTMYGGIRVTFHSILIPEVIDTNDELLDVAACRHVYLKMFYLLFRRSDGESYIMKIVINSASAFHNVKEEIGIGKILEDYIYNISKHSTTRFIGLTSRSENKVVIVVDQKEKTIQKVNSGEIHVVSTGDDNLFQSFKGFFQNTMKDADWLKII